MKGLLAEITLFLEEVFSGDFSGHDAEHILQVYRLAMSTWGKEGGGKEIVVLAAQSTASLWRISWQSF